jgi:diguanylate cyclase (GGDEF) domain
LKKYRVFKWLISFLIVFAEGTFAMDTGLALTREESEFLMQNRSFSVYVERNFAPFSFWDGVQLSGYSVDFANLIAQRLGVSFHYKTEATNWKSAVDKFKEGKIDIIAQMTSSSDRKSYALFSQPYMSHYHSIVVPKEKRAELNSLEKLKGKVVGVINGYAVQSELSEHYPEIGLRLFEDNKQLVEAVMLGRVDASIATHQVVQRSITSNFITDIVSIPILDNIYFPIVQESFGIQKSERLLASAIGKAIDSLSVEQAKLQVKWFGDSVPKYVALTESESNFLNAFGPIKYCIDPKWKPLDFENSLGEPDGLSADVLALFMQRSSIRFRYVPTASWADSVKALKERQCDVLAMAAQAKERDAFMTLSTPYANFPVVVATQIHQPFVSRVDDILDKTFSVVRSYSIVSSLRHKYPNIKLIEVDKALNGLKMVASGEVYGYLDSVASISHVVEEHEMAGIKVSAKMDETFSLGLGVRNDYPDLISIINKHVESIEPTIMQSLISKRVAIRYDISTDYSLIWKVLFVVVVFALFVIFRYRELAKMNKKIQLAYDEMHAAKQELELLVSQDYLTGLFNRKKLDELMARECIESKHYGRPLGVIMIDIDHFKDVNDTYGHSVGDDVIGCIARLLKQHARPSDKVGRWGGEEFMVLCPNTPPDELIAFAEMIRAQVSSYDITIVGTKTISLGLAVLEPFETVVELHKRADNALYVAKNNGRNRVEFLEPSACLAEQGIEPC